jgi:probable addiction module antidote protein
MPRSRVAKLKPFDVASHLVDRETAADYLAATLEAGEPSDFVRALGHVMEASMKWGDTTFPPRLARSVRTGAHPQFRTVLKILDHLGLCFSIRRKVVGRVAR